MCRSNRIFLAHPFSSFTERESQIKRNRKQSEKGEQ